MRFNEYQREQENKIREFMKKCDEDYIRFNQKIQEFLNKYLFTILHKKNNQFKANSHEIFIHNQ